MSNKPAKSKGNTSRKCGQRNHGVPSAGYMRADTIREKLSLRPLHEFARCRRLKRKLGLTGTTSGSVLYKI